MQPQWQSLVLPPALGKGNTHGVRGKRVRAKLRSSAGNGPAGMVAEEIAQSAHSISEAVSRGHRRRHVRGSGLRSENGLPVDSDRWLGIAVCRLHRSRRDAAGRATPSEGTQSLHQDRTAAHTFSEHLSNCHNWRAFMLTSRATVERFSGPRGRGYARVLQAAERSRE